MEIESFKHSFDTLFLSELDILLSRTKNRTHNPHINGLLDHVLELAKNGKRIRPYVIALSYGAKTFEETSPIYSQLIGIELLHLFALIHDDIMDEALTRHNVQSINAFSENKYSTSQDAHSQGKHEAILIGDLVFSFACSTFSRNATPPILKLFYELIDEVILGQMIDIRIPHEDNVDEVMIRERMLLKTARYSFARPMQIGAILAHKNPKEIEALFNLGEELGIIFQITDDIIDILGKVEETHKPPLQDLYNGQETFLTFHVKTKCEEYYRELQNYAKRSLTEDEAREAIDIFHKSNSIEYAKEYITLHKVNAEKILEKNDRKEDWTKLLNKILHRKS